MAVPPLIATEVLAPHEVVGQDLGSLGTSLNPNDANLRDAGLAIALLTGVGVLMAARNPKAWLVVLTATLGADILASFVILSRPTPAPTASVASSSGGAT